VVMLTDTPSNDDREFEYKFCAEMDTRSPKRPGVPRGADCDTEEDREHEGVEIGLSCRINFNLLQQDRGLRDCNANNDARQ
jgi:hypothetical protein